MRSFDTLIFDLFDPSGNIDPYQYLELISNSLSPQLAMPRDSILEPYSEVEDVAENVLISLFTV